MTTNVNFDSEITVTRVTKYTSFTIMNINIQFNQPASVDVVLHGETDTIENIKIPVEVYTAWQYDETQIIQYCKNFLQTKYQ